jgi:phage major head subunit gpT-like protein
MGIKFTKELWETPEHRSKMKARDAATKQMRKEDPWATTNWGVPFGIGGKKNAIPLWRAAHKLADKYLDYMKKTDQAPSTTDVTVVDQPNIIPHTAMVVPDSDEEKAVSLREAFLLAVGPTAIPEKIKAINTVLAYTKTKPEAQHKLRVEKAEDFLDLIAEVRSPTDDDDAEAD